MSLKISLLGGVGEIGMNMYVYESESSALIVDCGVMFADAAFPGVDFIIPDFAYLETIKSKLKGIVLSHGHEDHIGGVPYLLKQYPMPIYGGRLTIKLLESKIKENKLKADIQVVHANDEISIGDFNVVMLPINHSISDTYALHILHPDLNCLHASDFKIDQSPVNGQPFSPELYLQAAERGIDCLISDSTNVGSSNFTPSEASVKKDIKEIFSSHNGRIFFTTFASNIDRIQQVVEICNEVGRKVVFEGRSIVRNVEIASKLGYIRIPNGLSISLSDSKKIPEDKVCYIISGCQGEQQSTLFKVVSCERKNLQTKQGDLFVISARVIPGNEKNLNETINNIYINGGEVVDIQKKHVHVSGHASAEELKLMLNLTKPNYLIPVHGEYYHLKKHIELGVSSGFIQPDNALFSVAGDQLVFDNRQFIYKTEVPFGRMFIDRRGSFVFGKEMLKTRKQLARDGVAVIQMKCDPDGVIMEPPTIKTEGFKLSTAQQFSFRKHIMDNLPVLNESVNDDIDGLKGLILKLAKTYFKKNLDRRPVVTVIEI